jgi:hypothetical protein
MTQNFYKGWTLRETVKIKREQQGAKGAHKSAGHLCS